MTALFVENLHAFPADRCQRLKARLDAAGLPPLEAVFALVWPDYPPNLPPRPQDNRAAFAAWRSQAGVPLWAWLNAKADQAADAQAIETLDAQLDPDGWLLDIEGQWVKGAKLNVLLATAAALGRPRIASLAGSSSSHVEYHYRELDRQGYDVDWQAYPDTGEGPPPDVAIAELHKSSFVVGGWEYRHRVGENYGFGKVTALNSELASFDSYLLRNKPKGTPSDSVFGVLEREWGATVDDRVLWPKDPKKPPIGLVMGRFPYARTRVTLDIASAAGNVVALPELERRAASARVAGARKRPVSVFLAERDNDACDRIFAIAQGAA